MCRNIKVLFNFDPPANATEVRAAATQFVNKVSGNSKPSVANQAAYDQAIDEISDSVTGLLATLTTRAKPKNREIEAARAKVRAQQRFART